MDILIDYLTFTSKIHSRESLIKLLRLEGIYNQLGKGYNGWQICENYGGIKLLSGWRNDVCIDMSGKGCRLLETVWENKFDWLALFDKLVSHGELVNFSRLDIACDDKEDILNIKRMVDYTCKNRYISRFRSRRWIAGDEESIIFGSPSSNTRLRIYNKALERNVDGHWIRVEFQFRNESADSFIVNLLNYGEIGKVYGGVMNNYLRYTVKNPEHCNGNYDKVKTVKWWRDFVGTSEKIKNIKVGGLEYNYDNLEYFLREQCASSLKAFLIANDGDVTKLLDIANRAKLNKKQLTMLEGLRLSNAN